MKPPKKKANWIGTLALMTLAISPVTASADSNGGGGTGGGLAADNGVLLDFYETTIDPLMGASKFDPKSTPAFQQRLLPLLKDLAGKLPRVPGNFIQRIDQMEWYVTDQPIADSNDECALLKVSRKQIAKQVGNRVVISREWLDHADQTNIAGLIAHETFMNISEKEPGQCSTKVRDAVRALFAVKDKSPVEMRKVFVPLSAGFGWQTKQMLDEAQQLLAPSLAHACEGPEQYGIHFTNSALFGTTEITRNGHVGLELPTDTHEWGIIELSYINSPFFGLRFEYDKDTTTGDGTYYFPSQKACQDAVDDLKN